MRSWNKYLLVAALAVSAAACEDATKGDEATVTEQKETSAAAGDTYLVDTASSTVRFTGYGVGKNHPGIFKLSSGTVVLANNQVAGGTFDINIKSMDMEEEGEKIDGKLRPHLLSDEFFDAEKHGTAKFEITGVAPYQANDKDTSVVDGANFSVSGNLTLKGITKNVTFPAKIDVDGNTLKAKADFNIDRTQWNMNYGNDKSLGNNFISESVNVKLDVEAKK